MLMHADEAVCIPPSIAVEGKAWLVESADFLMPGHLKVSLLPRAKTLAGLACTSGRQIASQGKR
jgi:hypothetical protein